MRPLGPANGPLRTFRNDDKKIEIAAVIGPAPRMGTKKPNLLRLKLVRETADDIV